MNSWFRIPCGLAVLLWLGIAAAPSQGSGLGLGRPSPPQGPPVQMAPVPTGQGVPGILRDSPGISIRKPPSPAVIYPRPGGGVTDTGVPLHGSRGVLRDPAGGVWNCTGSGCFDPGGRFVPAAPTRGPVPVVPVTE